MHRLREHTIKRVLVCFEGGGYWEEWQFRFNVGKKQNRPVKFFADRIWRSDQSRCIIPFSGTHWDYESKAHAEEHFSKEAAAHGGTVVNPTKKILNDLKENFGYAI